MIRKMCKGCGSKDNSFYRHPGMTDGYLNYCKVCVRERVTRHRHKNIESAREYDRKRAKEPHRITLNASVTKKWRKDNPEKYRAQNILNNAIRDGKIERQPCHCGEKAHAHHHDYSRPLDVTWLCAIHHKGHHSRSAV